MAEQRGGFDFDHCSRNQFLQDTLGVKPPKTKKNWYNYCWSII